MAFVELADGAEIFYGTFGEGLPLVFLHGGMGFDSSYLRNAFLPLADAGVKLVFFDFRGNGRSSRRPADLNFTVETLIEDVEELRGKLELGRIVLFGHSIAGVVAQEYAARFSEQIAGLILDSTFAAFGAEIFAEIERRVSPDELKIFLEAFGSPAPDDETFAETVESVLSLYFYRFDEQKARRFFGEMRFSAAAFNHSVNLSASINTNKTLPQIKAPTLICAGRHDLFGLAQTAEKLREKIPHAELVIYEESGHYPFLEESEKYLQIVKDFLNGISA